jgi:Mg-chelatase subunit ChlI
VVADCPFGCDPDDPCGACAVRREAGGDLPVAHRRARIVTLPLNATEDRVAGSVDIGRALREGIAALQPGLLAEANRGILYVDEINLLDDHLCDILLDAAAMGVNVVEREGVSLAHPARFLLVGTMNPEEGELRPQIADRIGLHVEVGAILDAGVRAEVLRRREAYTADARGFAMRFAVESSDLAARVERARVAVGTVDVPDPCYTVIAKTVVRLGVVSHRADVTILQCAKALAALDGRGRVGGEDVFAAARLALGHRIATDPFAAGAGLDDRLLRRVLEEVGDVALEEENRKKAAGPATSGT